MSSGFDAIVVGAGAAGCVLAARLSEDIHRSVLLLEAGPDRTGSITPALRDGWRLPRGADWPDDWGYVSEPDLGGEPQPLRRGRFVGGTSWLTRFAVRGAPAQFDAWAASGLAGWSFEDVLPFFRRVERDLDFGRAAWHGTDGPVPITCYPDLEPTPVHAVARAAFVASGFEAVDDVNRPDAEGVGPMPMSSDAGRRVSASDAYLTPAVRRPNLTIRANAQVAAIGVGGGQARGVRLVDGSIVPADMVVVCGGTYGSPTLLLRSGIGPAEELAALGVPVHVDLPGVGQNLADHPAVEVGTGWSGASRSEPILHSIAPWRSTLADPGAAPDMLFWFADPQGDPPELGIECVLMRPHARGSVRLRSVDPGDPPRISLPRLTERGDVTRLAEAATRALEIANRPELRAMCAGPASGPPSEGTALDAWVRGNAYSIPHVVGTCAMGSSPDDGAVVDGDGRVHGIEGLRVVDASIIPEPPSGFPNLVTMMLAERIVAGIAGG